MPSRIRFLLAIALALALPGAAQAAVLTTAPFIPTGSQRIQCGILNAGNTARPVTIDWIDEDGDVVISTNEVNVPAGGSFASYTSFGIERSCRFTVQGAKDSWRAHLVLFDSTSGLVLATSDAR
jgi:hypothetical protein